MYQTLAIVVFSIALFLAGTVYLRVPVVVKLNLWFSPRALWEKIDNRSDALPEDVQLFFFDSSTKLVLRLYGRYVSPAHRLDSESICVHCGVHRYSICRRCYCGDGLRLCQ